MNQTTNRGESNENTDRSKAYPLLVAKAEKKGRSKAEVDEVTAWLTGYDMSSLDLDMTYEEFFENAPEYNRGQS